MKVYLVCLLAITGTLGFPQREEAISNSIEQTYDDDKNQTEYLPVFSLPIFLYKEVLNLKPNQMRYIADMAKPLIKPILTSVELQILTEFIDETLRMFKTDPDIKRSLKDGVDSLQNMYENSDSEMVEQFLTWIVSLYSDEATARSFSSLLSDVSPTLRSWVVDPVKEYYRAFITPTIKSLTKTLNSFFGEDLSTNEIARSGRWSNIVDLYIERLAEMTSQAKNIMSETAEFLDKQDREQDY